MSDVNIFTADKIFDGSQWLYQQAIIVEDNIITDIASISSASVIVSHHYPIIIPAFIDAQIYGANHTLFSSYPSADTILNICNYCSDGGAAHFIPTIATNTYEVIYQSIDAVKEYWKSGGKGCLGLHLEGPWINPVKCGAHPITLIHTPTIAQVKSVLDYGKDAIKIITLAPEVCSDAIIQLIQSYSVIISIGHSNASFNEANQAFDKGIHTATHLYNAMSGLQHRAPGLVGAIFQHPTAMASIIADGHHVDYDAVSIAHKMMGDRLFAITDAVTENNIGLYQHQFNANKYESDGILSGSALTMKKGFDNLIQYCKMSIEDAIKMCSTNVARCLQMEDTLGIIKKGVPANFLCMDEALEIIRK